MFTKTVYVLISKHLSSHAIKPVTLLSGALSFKDGPDLYLLLNSCLILHACQVNTWNLLKTPINKTKNTATKARTQRLSVCFLPVSSQKSAISPLTHLKTSSALFRHQGMVISYTRSRKQSDAVGILKTRAAKLNITPPEVSLCLWKGSAIYR